MSFNLPQLPYAYDALEPYIDTRTMEIHYTKHHKAYTDNLNNAIKGTPLEGKTIQEILQTLDPENKAVRNNGGGYYNHNLFWEILSAKKTTPSAELSKAIEAAFGSFEAFKEAFSKAAATQFGSGWAWLAVEKGGKVGVCATANQDNPLMSHIKCGTPILGLDVWKTPFNQTNKNRRADYIEAFFNIINWDKVSELYNQYK